MLKTNSAMSMKLTKVNEIQLDGGWINSLSFSADGKYLLAGVGQEHRLGRWFCDKKGRNGIAFISLQYNEGGTEFENNQDEEAADEGLDEVKYKEDL